MKKKIKKIAIATTISAIIGVSAIASATPITIDYSGTWDVSGKSFSGQVKYDTEHVDHDSLNSYHGSYNPTYFSLATTTWEAHSANALINVYDNNNGDQFTSSINQFTPGFTTTSSDVTYIAFSLKDDNQSLFSSDSLPSTLLDLSLCEYHSVTVYMNYYLHGTIDRLTLSSPSPIPEPTTIFLLGTGLAGIITSRKRKTTNS